MTTKGDAAQQRQTTPYTLRHKDGHWIAHAVAFDLIGSGQRKDEAVAQLKMCLGAQIAFGAKRGFGISQCFFAAPVEYWVAPYEFMPLPTNEELAAFKFEVAARCTLCGAIMAYKCLSCGSTPALTVGVDRGAPDEREEFEAYDAELNQERVISAVMCGLQEMCARGCQEVAALQWFQEGYRAAIAKLRTASEEEVFEMRKGKPTLTGAARVPESQPEKEK